MLSKNGKNKKCAPKLIFFNEKNIEKDLDDFWDSFWARFGTRTNLSIIWDQDSGLKFIKNTI